MIRHIVFCKFKDEASDQTIEAFITECDRLPAINREVKNWVSGRAVEPRFHSGDFDWALSCDLEDAAAMDRYMWHEAHLRMGSWAGLAIDYMQSFDFELDYLAPKEFPGAAPGPDHDAPPDGRMVPQVVGRRLEDALQVLSDAGLEVDPDTDEILGSVWAPGRVMRSQPRAGDVVAVGSTVHLSVTGQWWSRPDFSDIDR